MNDLYKNAFTLISWIDDQVFRKKPDITLIYRLNYFGILFSENFNLTRSW